MLLALALLAVAPNSSIDPIVAFEQLCTQGIASFPANSLDATQRKFLPSGVAAAIKWAVFVGSGLLDDKLGAKIDNPALAVRHSNPKIYILPPMPGAKPNDALGRSCSVVVEGDRYAQTKAEVLRLANLRDKPSPLAKKGGWEFPHVRVVVGTYQVAAEFEAGWTALVATPLDSLPPSK